MKIVSQNIRHIRRVTTKSISKFFIVKLCFAIFFIGNIPLCYCQNTVASNATVIEKNILFNKDSFYYIDFKSYYTKPAADLPIGVFDSGTGGLTVLNAIVNYDHYNNLTHVKEGDKAPDFEHEKFIYLADQANMPYGNYYSENKTDLLVENVIKDAQFLLSDKYYKTEKDSAYSIGKEHVKAIVIACNTATAYAKKQLEDFVGRTGLPMKIIGVIDAGAKGTLAHFGANESGSIGVLATVGTIASKGYEEKLISIRKSLNLKGKISIFNQGGYGIAEAVDNDPSYINKTASSPRDDYRGPSLTNPDYMVDKTLLDIYHFDFSNYHVLCNSTNTDECQILQLNSPGNYVRYHLVSLLERMRKAGNPPPLKAIILGCTHYPFLIKEIRQTLKDLYEYRKNGKFVYRSLMSPNIQIVDPAELVAQELYEFLKDKNLFNANGDIHSSEFYITVPNLDNKNVKVDDYGHFTYAYKYGRMANEIQEYVKCVPFNNSNIDNDTFTRFKEIIPSTYEIIQRFLEENNKKTGNK